MPRGARRSILEPADGWDRRVPMLQDPIIERFASRARRTPAAVAVASPTAAATVAEIDDLAGVIASRLAAARLESGRPVALAAVNGPGFLAGFVALRRAHHPVVLLDQRMPAAERQVVAEHLGAVAAVMIADRWPSDAGAIGLTPTAASPVPLPPDTVSIRLTSGSTGMPRGIAHTAAALLADDHQLTATMALADDERILASVPLSHAYGFASIALPALVRAATLVVPDDDGPFAALAAARACEVTFLPTVPAYLQVVVRMEQPPVLPPTTRLVISAGAPLPPATAARFRDLYGQPVHVFYGASEVGGITYDRVGDAGERGTLGTPVDGVAVELRPADGASNGTGLVVVRSAAAAVCTLPDTDPRLGDGELVTSDLARFDERGELVLIGRADDIINVRGKKVNPREVERILAALPGAGEVVVLGVPAADGGQRLRAVVATTGGIDEAAVRSWCAARLAAHKVPRSILLVSEIPRTARGKVDRRALAELGGGSRDA